MIRSLEELSLNAWPSLRQILLDGWVLRFADGFTRRANSVNPLYPGRLDVHEKVRLCERLYRERQLPVVFKMTSASEPAELDHLLQQRGYRAEAQSSVQCMSLESLQADETPHLRTWDRVSDPWITSYMTFNETPPARRAVLGSLLANIACPKHFIELLDGNEPAACGMAVLQGEHVGLFDIVTRKDRRRQGLGTRLVNALLAWGRANGARQAYLQVMLNNPPALSLYRRIGFSPAYEYWYRCL